MDWKTADPSREPTGIWWQASMLAFVVIILVGAAMLSVNAAAYEPSVLVANLGASVTVIGIVGLIASAAGAWATRIWN